MKTYRAFTLVELIVVISILAILATIAFIAYDGYSSSARDSKRMSETSELYKGLSLAFVKAAKYPEETNMASIMSGSTTLAKQSKIGKTLGSFLGVSSDLFSASSNYSDYTYTLNPSGSRAQVTSFLEKPDQATATMQTGSITKYLFSKGDRIPVLLASSNYEPTGGNASEQIDIASDSVVAFVGVSSTGTLVTYTTPTDLINQLPALYENGYVSGSGGSETPPATLAWTTIDTNCTKPSVVVGSQTWAGCNSTIGTITQTYSTGSCNNYAGGTTGNTNCYGATTKESTALAGQSDNIYGGLYRWNILAAACMANHENGGILPITDTTCPCQNGYHIPSDSEWSTLEITLGCSDAATTTGWRCSSNLSDTINGLGWTSSNSNSLKSKLGLTLAGLCNVSSCLYRGINGGYWSSTWDSSNAWRRGLYYSYASAIRNNYSQLNAFSVRCIKD